MRKLTAVVLLLLLVAGFAYAKDYEVKKKAGEYNVEVKIDKNPPVLGENNMEIGIKDAKGKHVTDAKVVVEYSMPGMPGMPPMNYKTNATLSENEYQAKLDFSMRGSWNIAIKIARDSKTSTVKFTVDVK
ncbi:MAG: FixH family protein [Nitrospirae bacterium]|nr:FixH family protein [Nitrospirota bacterium]